jgi:alkylresorcinol/alkylpyrone synthase
LSPGLACLLDVRLELDLLSIATAVPGHVHRPGRCQAVAREAFGRKPLFDRLSGVFDNAAIATRHVVAPIE